MSPNISSTSGLQTSKKFCDREEGKRGDREKPRAPRRGDSWRPAGTRHKADPPGRAGRGGGDPLRLPFLPRLPGLPPQDTPPPPTTSHLLRLPRPAPSHPPAAPQERKAQTPPPPSAPILPSRGWGSPAPGSPHRGLPGLGEADVAAALAPPSPPFPPPPPLPSPPLRSPCPGRRSSAPAQKFRGPHSASRAPAAGPLRLRSCPRSVPAKMARRSRRCLLLLLRCLVVALGCPKTFGLSDPKDHQVITAIEYQEVILTCKFPRKTPASRLEWKKLGPSVSFVYYGQDLRGDFKDRAEMMDFSIRIKNVTRNDAGKYRCEVSTPTNEGQRLEENTVMLEVLVAPGVPTCNVPSSVLSGTVVELRCQDKEGNPAPTYTWFKDGTRLLGNPRLDAHVTNSSYTMNTKSGTLQFNTISKLDSGEYYCEARNSVGSRRCREKKMQVDDLNVSGIIAAVVVVALVISICGLGVCYAQRKGYFSKETFQKSNPASKAIPMGQNDFKHSKSFII